MSFLKRHSAVALGVFITLFFLVLSVLKLDFFESLELKFYDTRMHFRANANPSDDIILVEIDDESIEKMGRWPWPRYRIADGIRKISSGNPKVIGLNFIYSESEESGALKELQYLQDLIAKMASDQQRAVLIKAFKETQEKLDNDKRLVEALESTGNIVLPVYFRTSRTALDEGVTDPALERDFIKKVRNIGGPLPLSANDITTPLPQFMKATKGLGHVNLLYDVDGKIRKEPLVYQYNKSYMPSYSLKLAAIYLNVPPEDIQLELGISVQLGEHIIPVDSRSELLINFKKPDVFKRYSFFQVVNDLIPSSVFQNKIVLVSPSAAGLFNPLSTPVTQAMPVGELTANTIQTVLDKQYVKKPGWNFIAQMALILIIGALISLVLPRMKALLGGVMFLALLAVLVGSSVFVFKSMGLWIKLIYPLLQLVVGYLGAVSVGYFVTETSKERIEGESAETNRMLGLSFQSQGMLDMALDKFMKVPVDDQMKDILYNLALDFERKRQFNKAASVYEHIEKHDPNFKDVSTRGKKLVQASETMVFGDSFLTGSSTSGGDGLLTSNSDVRPTLGRYEIVKQLGKGAMGVVYLGQDKLINRTTAIKTFRFSDDYEPEEIEKMKEKFFREAESAGTLSHPNIVTIYDAGQEQDLAYIAMEYLEGTDFQKYTKKKNLLPMRKVIEYVGDIAEGLDYAHKKGVVHRDIKPANVMLLKTGVAKITDFGIARITASSQTQTGIVKGTPHYMSPEQISGEKVDGRSDIFSLGAMLFQLLTGDVPFHGDSPAALMHQIITVPHPNPQTLNPKIIKPLVTIIDKAMEKDRDKRYLEASQMAAHLRAVGKKIDAIMAQKKKAAST